MGKVRYPIAGNVVGQVWCQGQSQNQSRRPLTMMCLAKRQFEPGSDRMHMSFGQGLGVRIAEVCDRSIFFFEIVFSSYHLSQYDMCALFDVSLYQFQHCGSCRAWQFSVGFWPPELRRLSWAFHLLCILMYPLSLLCGWMHWLRNS